MSTSSISIQIVSRTNAALLLGDVDPDVFDHSVQLELLMAFLENPANHLVVAIVEGRVVGMASGISYVHPDKPLALFINEVGVASQFRRQGLGRRLVSRLIDLGKELGCVEAWVATEVGNTAARRLYESLGGMLEQEQAVVYVYPLAANHDAGGTGKNSS